MAIYNYEEAFGAADQTSREMRNAIEKWFRLYYGASGAEKGDSCQRIAYTVVGKLVRTVFGEYQATAPEPFAQKLLDGLKGKARQAMELSMIGGCCYIKPCPGKTGFSFALIPRNQVLIFGRDGEGRG